MNKFMRREICASNNIAHNVPNKKQLLNHNELCGIELISRLLSGMPRINYFSCNIIIIILNNFLLNRTTNEEIKRSYFEKLIN